MVPAGLLGTMGTLKLQSIHPRSTTCLQPTSTSAPTRSTLRRWVLHPVLLRVPAPHSIWQTSCWCKLWQKLASQQLIWAEFPAFLMRLCAPHQFHMGEGLGSSLLSGLGPAAEGDARHPDCPFACQLCHQLCKSFKLNIILREFAERPWPDELVVHGAWLYAPVIAVTRG